MYGPRRDAAVVATLAVLCVAFLVGSGWIGLRWVPISWLVVPIYIGGLLLRVRLLGVVVAIAAVAYAIASATMGVNSVRPGNAALLVAGSLVSLASARAREDSGLVGLRGEGMLVDLRDRLRLQGELPDLPRGWRAEVVQTSAGGGSFGGDFMVSCLTDGDRRLELALVDVSGKGVQAGTRALQLAGALGGLLGAVTPERFLPAAHDYLERQEWDEGFATAVHVALDLHTGDYLIESAGHPPAAHFRAGSGRWDLSEAAGSVLGLFPSASWTGERGRIGSGDALLLYTDGVIEVPGRDIGLGVDKLLGEANRLVVTTFAGGAERLIHAVSPDATDDKALILLWRT